MQVECEVKCVVGRHDLELAMTLKPWPANESYNTSAASGDAFRILLFLVCLQFSSLSPAFLMAEILLLRCGIARRVCKCDSPASRKLPLIDLCY